MVRRLSACTGPAAVAAGGALFTLTEAGLEEEHEYEYYKPGTLVIGMLEEGGAGEDRYVHLTVANTSNLAQ